MFQGIFPQAGKITGNRKHQAQSAGADCLKAWAVKSDIPSPFGRHPLLAAWPWQVHNCPCKGTESSDCAPDSVGQCMGVASRKPVVPISSYLTQSHAHPQW